MYNDFFLGRSLVKFFNDHALNEVGGGRFAEGVLLAQDLDALLLELIR